MGDIRSRVIVALDTADLGTARGLVQALDGRPAWYKVGMELFYSAGWEAVDMVSSSGASVFLDIKFHDIPNTVAGACRSCARKGVGMFSMHAAAGAVAMREAVRAADDAREKSGARPRLIGVTVLTSIDEKALREEVGMAGSVISNVVRLAVLCKECGLDGVVASPLEAAAIREAVGPGFLIVTPGIRPSWSVTGDQRRHTTPRQALLGGADHIVVGRPITAAPDPLEAYLRVCEEIEQVGERK